MGSCVRVYTGTYCIHHAGMSFPAEWVTGAPRANEYLGQVHVLTLQLAEATSPLLRNPLISITGTKVHIAWRTHVRACVHAYMHACVSVCGNMHKMENASFTYINLSEAFRLYWAWTLPLSE